MVLDCVIAKQNKYQKKKLDKVDKKITEEDLDLNTSLSGNN